MSTPRGIADSADADHDATADATGRTSGPDHLGEVHDGRVWSHHEPGWPGTEVRLDG